MPRSRKLCKKKCFRGNQYKPVSSEGTVLVRPRPTSQATAKPNPPSASRRKIGEIPYNSENVGHNNIIVSMSILTQALLDATLCKFCKQEQSLSLKEDEDARQGLACKLLVLCSACGHNSSFWSSDKTESFFDVNLKCVYGLRSIGKGSVAGRTLFEMLDLPSPPLRFERFNPLFLKSLKKVATESMVNATEETVELSVSEDGDVSSDISVGIDGTWLRRGFSSMNGVVSVSSFETSKILYIEVLTKYCHTCQTNKGVPHFCDKNIVGSSGAMEVEGAKNVFDRSERTRNVRYKYILVGRWGL